MRGVPWLYESDAVTSRKSTMQGVDVSLMHQSTNSIEWENRAVYL